MSGGPVGTGHTRGAEPGRLRQSGLGPCCSGRCQGRTVLPWVALAESVGPVPLEPAAEPGGRPAVTVWNVTPGGLAQAAGPAGRGRMDTLPGERCCPCSGKTAGPGGRDAGGSGGCRGPEPAFHRLPGELLSRGLPSALGACVQVAPGRSSLCSRAADFSATSFPGSRQKPPHPAPAPFHTPVLSRPTPGFLARPLTSCLVTQTGEDVSGSPA